MPFNARPLAALLVALPLMTGAVAAGPALDKALRPACRAAAVCVINDSPGGDVAIFQSAAQEVLREGKKLVIDGRCVSACVILADLARANTCLTPRAELAVHQSATLKIVGRAYDSGRAVAIGRVVSRQDPPQSADINAWVASHGGYPEKGFMAIPLQDARLFWAMCD
jgi:hypothetical protein